jgi:type II secretory pathway pseudopilin PulG
MKKGILADVIIVLVIVGVLTVLLVPVMLGWNHDVAEAAVRNEGWVYLNAAKAVVDSALEGGEWFAAGGVDVPDANPVSLAVRNSYYVAILTNPEFAAFVQKARLSLIPRTAEGSPHVNDIFVDDKGYPSAVHVRNVVIDGGASTSGLIVGSRPEGGFWLRGGAVPRGFS